MFGKNMAKCYVFGKKYLHLQMSVVYIESPFLHIIRASPGGLPGLPAGEGTPLPPGKYWRPASAAAGFDLHPEAE